jgi:hypothetical protein
MLKVIETYRLQNDYWLKIKYELSSQSTCNIFMVDIVVAKTLRQCNDNFNKTKNSPKNLRNKSTNSKGGLEALRIALESVLNFKDRLVEGCYLHVEASNQQRANVYSRLTRYGFVEGIHNSPKSKWHEQKYYYLKV